MNELLLSIKESLESKNWYAALTVALILPDICGKIDTPGMKSGKRYASWFDKYVKKYYTVQESTDFALISGGDCYAIRCAMLHEFSKDLTMHNARKIIDKYKFCSPETCSFGTKFRVKQAGNEIELNVSDFCGKMIIGVNAWLKESRNNTNIFENFVKIE